MSERRTFIIELRPLPGVDPIRALKALLKYALRVLGLRCTKITPKRRAKSWKR